MVKHSSAGEGQVAHLGKEKFKVAELFFQFSFLRRAPRKKRHASTLAQVEPSQRGWPTSKRQRRGGSRSPLTCSPLTPRSHWSGWATSHHGWRLPPDRHHLEHPLSSSDLRLWVCAGLEAVPAPVAGKVEDHPGGSRGSKGRAGQAGQDSSRLALARRRGRVGGRRRLWATPWEGSGAGGRWPGTARCRRRPWRCRTRCPRRTSGKPAASHVSSQSHGSGPDTINNESLIQIELGETMTLRHVKIGPFMFLAFV